MAAEAAAARCGTLVARRGNVVWAGVGRGRGAGRSNGSLEAHGSALGGGEGDVGHVVGVVAADEGEQVEGDVCGEQEADGKGDVGAVRDQGDDSVDGGTGEGEWVC